jgi:hypothetical protein
MLSGLVPSWFRPKPPQVNTMRVGAKNLNPPKPTIRVIMLKTTLGAPDSISTVEYEAGKQYDVPEDLAECFFSTGAADPAEAHAAADGHENKRIEGFETHPPVESQEEVDSQDGPNTATRTKGKQRRARG